MKTQAAKLAAMTPGQRLQAARYSRNVTRAALAEATGATVGIVKGVELHGVLPRRGFLQRCAQALGAPLEELTGPPRPLADLSRMRPGRRLRVVRRDRGVRAGELAAAVGCTVAALHAVEGGRNVPRWGFLQRCATALDVDLVLLTGPKPDLTGLGRPERLRALRLWRAVPRAEIVAALGYRERLLAELELGETRITNVMIERLCEVLDVDPGDLLGPLPDLTGLTPARRLNAVRTWRNLTQPELAARINAPKTCVQRWELGRVPLPGEALPALAVALDVPLHVLTGGQP